VVVPQQRALQASLGGQVGGTDTQVASGRDSRVEHVVGVGYAVAGTVSAEDGPRPGDELHRPDGTIPEAVAVPPAAVVVADRREMAGTVEHGTEDPGNGVTRRRHLSTASVSRLDLADPGQYLPTQAAGRVVDSEPFRRLLVRREHGRGNRQVADVNRSRDRNRRPGRLGGRRRHRRSLDLGNVDRRFWNPPGLRTLGGGLGRCRAIDEVG
jgi:hypothetical protein